MGEPVSWNKCQPAATVEPNLIPSVSLSKPRLCFPINPPSFLSFSSVGSLHLRSDYYGIIQTTTPDFPLLVCLVWHTCLAYFFFFNIFTSFWISKVCSYYKIQKVQKLHRQKPEPEKQFVPKKWQSLDLNAGWRGTHAFDHGRHCWVIKSGLLISSAHREVRNYIFLHQN